MFFQSVIHSTVQSFSQRKAITTTPVIMIELFNLMRCPDDPSSLNKDLSPLILETVRKMARTESPSSFFNFDGKECGLIADNVHFPGSAYTFSCWVRLERTAQNHSSRFFSFFDRKGNGVEMIFRGNHLCVQTITSSKKINRIIMDHFFHTNRWYHVCIAHNKKFILSSDLQFYVDGKMRQQVELKYPSFSNPLSFAHFGTNVPYGIASQGGHAPTVILLRSMWSYCPFRQATFTPRYLKNFPMRPRFSIRIPKRRLQSTHRFMA